MAGLQVELTPEGGRYIRKRVQPDPEQPRNSACGQHGDHDPFRLEKPLHER
jgi:hypothetical protein